MTLRQILGLSARQQPLVDRARSPAAASAAPSPAPVRDAGYEIVAAIARARLLGPASCQSIAPRRRS